MEYKEWINLIKGQREKWKFISSLRQTVHFSTEKEISLVEPKYNKFLNHRENIKEETKRM